MSDTSKTGRTKPRSETRKRTKGAFVRFDDNEWIKLQSQAERSGLSVAAYLRVCALGDAGPRARRSPTINRVLAANAVAELNKVGSNLNQIARAMNRQDWSEIAALPAAVDAVKLAARQVLRAFGYKTDDS